MPQLTGGLTLADLPIVADEFASARRQLGTLGGGNHFIEIQQGSDGHIWLMVHSGSRNLGYQVANSYNRLAKERADAANTRPIPAKWQLDYLLLDSEKGQRYLREMSYCVEFARANRREMMLVMQEMGQRLANETHGDAYASVRELNELLHQARLQIEQIKAERGADDDTTGEDLLEELND